MTDERDDMDLDTTPDEVMGLVRVVIERTGPDCRVHLKRVPIRNTLGCLVPTVVATVAIMIYNRGGLQGSDAWHRLLSLLAIGVVFIVVWIAVLQLWALVSRQSKLVALGRAAGTGHGGCVLTMIGSLIAILITVAFTDRTPINWEDRWEAFAVFLVPALLLLGVLWAVLTMSVSVTFEVRDGKLTKTAGVGRFTWQEHWYGADIRALGVHRGTGRGDSTRLEMVLRDGGRQKLHEDTSQMDLAVVAHVLREGLSVPEDAAYEAVEPDEQPVAERTPETLPRGTADKLIIEERDDGVHYRLANENTVGCMVMAIVFGAASAWYWGWGFAWHDEEVELMEMLLIGFFMLLSLAAVCSLIVWVIALVYREHFVLQEHKLIRQRSICGRAWRKTWDLDTATSFDLYLDPKSSNVHVKLATADGREELARWSWPASARAWVEDMSERTGVPVKRYDLNASYDL